MPVSHAHPAVFPDAQVAVFHPVAHLFRCSGAGIGTDIRFGAHFPAPFDVLVCAEGVRIFHLPALVVDGGAFRSHTVQPMIGGDETAAGPSYDGAFDFFQCVNHIGPEAVFIGKTRGRVVNAAVYLCVEMLDELAEYHVVVSDFR